MIFYCEGTNTTVPKHCAMGCVKGVEGLNWLQNHYEQVMKRKIRNVSAVWIFCNNWVLDFRWYQVGKSCAM